MNVVSKIFCSRVHSNLALILKCNRLKKVRNKYIICFERVDPVGFILILWEKFWILTHISAYLSPQHLVTRYPIVFKFTFLYTIYS